MRVGYNWLSAMGYKQRHLLVMRLALSDLLGMTTGYEWQL